MHCMDFYEFQLEWSSMSVKHLSVFELNVKFEFDKGNNLDIYENKAIYWIPSAPIWPWG